MTEQTDTREDVSNPLDVSDEEFLNSSLDSFVEEQFEEEDKDEEPSNKMEEEESEESDDKEDSDELDTNEDESESSEEDEVESETETETEEEEKKELTSEEYKSIVDELFSPFKANGKMLQVDNVEDVKNLMRMGANYNKKMAAIKPHLKIVRTLENNGLLTEDKLNMLIDASKGNKDALASLIKSSGIDPLELEENTEYSPNKYSVDDREVDLSLVLDEIKDTPTYSKTLSVVSKVWDEDSRKAVFEKPETIAILNDHMESGIYDQITEILESEKALGKWNGVSDIVAYRSIGDKLYEQGKLKGQQGSPAPSEGRKTTVVPKQNTETQDSIRAKRKAAAPSGRKAGKTDTVDFNPLSLSDDDFEKFDSSKFLKR